MDMLQKIFDKQTALQQRLGYDFNTMTDEARAAYIKEYEQHADHEMHEMLAEIPFFKSWKKYDKDSYAERNMRWEKARQEFIDAFHFYINVALALGFDAAQLFSMFEEKNSINHDRQLNTTEYKQCVEDTNRAVELLLQQDLSSDTATEILKVAHGLSERTGLSITESTFKIALAMREMDVKLKKAKGISTQKIIEDISNSIHRSGGAR